MKRLHLLLLAAAAITCVAAAACAQKNTDIPPQGTSTDAQLQHDDARVQELVRSMTLEEKLYQMMFVRPETLTGIGRAVQAGDSTKAAIVQQPVGGIIYFSQNFENNEQTTEMLRNTQDYARVSGVGIPLFMGVDEEGGMVARLASVLDTTTFDNMAVYGAQNDSEQAYDIGKTLAADLSKFGFNVDFAPVADVLSNENNTEIGARSFGSDPDVVSNMVRHEVKGLQENGVMAALKHFPGHGSTQSNSHKGTSESDRTLEQLRDCDFKPFEAGIEQDAAFVLISHMTATELDSVPCSLSAKVVTDLLRGELGYDGVVITDGMDMGAITQQYSNGEAAVKAVQAGVDMLLCPPSISDACDALSAAVADGTITQTRIDESVTRILNAKMRYGLMKE